MLGLSRHLGQALHHAGPGRDAARPRVPRVRSRPPRRRREDIGITCALIPTSHPGVEIGRRHMPLNAVFQNGPTWGKDVFIPMDWVIGGQPMLGRGWRMLMECLAAGRGISLPSSATGMAKLAVRTVGGYARVRQQFKTPIGKFEGIEEALTRMGGNLYMMDATAHADRRGDRPRREAGGDLRHRQAPSHRARPAGRQRRHGHRRAARASAWGRRTSSAPRTCRSPVAITVEGANILTRSLIVFGQGAIRCHPYVLKEMAATRETDRAEGVDRVRRGAVRPPALRARRISRARW